MVRTLGLVTVLVFAFGCSSANKRNEEVHVAEVKKENKAFEFDNHCAGGLCMKKGRVPCDPTITYEYKNKNYCFSSTKSRDHFIKDIDKNVMEAEKNWSAGGVGGGAKQ